MSEIEKLDEIDRKVLIWCARNQAHLINGLLRMYERDYTRKGIRLNTAELMTEVNRKVWNK